MNQHLAKAIEIYEQDNIDLQSLIGWHLSYGMVLSTPKVFALCFHSHSDEPNKAVAFEHSDTLFVTMCSGDMRKALRNVRDDFEYIAFQRDFKNSPRVRVYNMQQFYSKLK